MKLKLRKGLIMSLSVLLLIQCYELNSTNVSFADTNKDNYIVIAENKEATQEIIEKHDVNSDTGEALSVNLSAEEVAQLKADKDVICVEKDFTIERAVEAGEGITKPAIEDWNLKAINAENTTTNSTVKVAIIDSGIDYSEDILVKERYNFITDDSVTTPLFEDTCGHGTSVASIIAGKGIESNVKGINGDIELYSARVLDNKKQAPISRVVEAIYWAIEKDVHIINMSFGTQVYSEALKTAIDAATDKGILVIASTGNYGNSNIDYPAAFENVLAVGATNAAGEISSFSSSSKSVDLVAPGEAVSAQANFGEGLTLSGTSLAASHVTGVAACLWSKDLTKPASFIKVLLKLSAKEMDASGTGYGLVDYERALQVYNEIATQFDDVLEEYISSVSSDKFVPEDIVENEDYIEGTSENMVDVEMRFSDIGSESSEEVISTETVTNNSTELESQVINSINISANTEAAIDCSDSTVTGSWQQAVHEKNVANSYMKVGAIYADKHDDLQGIGANPEFHGFAWHADAGGDLGTGDCNFMANYRFLIKVANAYGNGSGYTSIKRTDIEGLSTTCYNRMIKGFEAIKKHDLNGAKTCKWCDNSVNIWNKGNDTYQKAFVMGLAMHVATDTFAHSAFAQMQSGSYSWKRITHTNGAADDPTHHPKRVQMAYAAEKNVVSRYNGNRGNYHTCNDFYNTTSGAYDLLTFRITKMRTFAEAAGYTTESVLSKFGKLQQAY